ncbi:hypothetical protein GCM10009664_67190 [Kitasatospora gansuensis]
METPGARPGSENRQSHVRQHRRSGLSPVVLAPSDLVAYRAQDPQDESDDDEGYADGPQDGYAGEETDDEEDDSEDDHDDLH